MLDLVLNAHPARGAGGRAFARPALIGPIPEGPRTFPTMAALAAELHRRRAGRGLRLTRVVAAHRGSDTFPAFEVWWIADDGTEEYAFTAYANGADRETFEQVIAAANPDQPRRAA